MKLNLFHFQELNGIFLSSDEELAVLRHYEKCLKELLQKFMPRQEPLPREVKGISYQLFKRFFLVTSVMDFHPGEIM